MRVAVGNRVPFASEDLAKGRMLFCDEQGTVHSCLIADQNCRFAGICICKTTFWCGSRWHKPSNKSTGVTIVISFFTTAATGRQTSYNLSKDGGLTFREYPGPFTGGAGADDDQILLVTWSALFGKFVMMSYDMRPAVSDDGITWTT